MFQSSYRDSLTGVYCRDFFRQQLPSAIEQLREQRRWGALLLLELTNFDGIERRFGQAQAEAVLARFAEVLRFGVRLSDLVARESRYRFAVLLKDGLQPAAAIQLCKRLCKQFDAPLYIRGDKVSVEVAAGIRLVVPDAASPLSLLQQAEQSLLAARCDPDQDYVLFHGEEDDGFDISHTGHDGRVDQ